MVECKCLSFIHKEKIPMDPTNKHRKGQHLTFECRVLIQTRLKDGWSPNRIAKKLAVHRTPLEILPIPTHPARKDP